MELTKKIKRQHHNGSGRPKVPYSHYVQAYTKARELEAEEFERWGYFRPRSAYICPICLMWHVGKNKQPVKPSTNDEKLDDVLRTELGIRAYDHMLKENRGRRKTRLDHIIKSYKSSLARRLGIYSTPSGSLVDTRSRGTKSSEDS